MKYTIGSAFIYFALWVKISFIDRPEDMNGETLRLWNLALTVRLALEPFAVEAPGSAHRRLAAGSGFADMVR